MSGLAAIIRFDGGAVEAGVIERMTSAMRHRGPDSIRHWTNSNRSVALGHCMLHTTAESCEAVQPLVNEDGSLALIMDGWLSNWEELRVEILGRGEKLRSRSDAELVLRAYEAWGAECLKKIDGEFAFAIWDNRQRKVFFANDHVGLKPIYYHWDGQCLTIASDIVGILANPRVEKKPNDARIMEYLTFNWATRGETIWTGVKRVVPAHWMRFGSRGCEQGKYWEPQFESKIRYASDEEYFEHYRELFSDCVRRASRTHRTLACDVSGGLDSSAVFAMAHDLRRKGRLPAPDIKGYTYHFSDANGTDHNEIEYARAVARHVGEAVQEVSPFLPDLQWFMRCGQDYQDIAGYPNGAMSIAIGEALVSDGCRVILNGEGGDEWLAGRPSYYAEQIEERDWAALRCSFFEDVADIGLRAAAWRLTRFGLAPTLPPRLRALRRKVTQLVCAHNRHDAPWLSDSFRSPRPGLHPTGSTTEYHGISNLAQRGMYMVLTDPFALVVWDQSSRQSARLGYEIRTPLYARKFINFAFATPERLRLRGSTTKFIHRASLTGLLPESVVKRKTKADFGVAFRRLMDAQESHMKVALREGGSGYLDGDGLSELYRQSRRKPEDFWQVWRLWTIFEVEDLLANC